jgi:hypothetical protein
MRVLLIDIEGGVTVRVGDRGRCEVERADGRVLSVYANSNGYPCVKLRNVQRPIHRLVAMTIANPRGVSDVNHIDGDKWNNCPSNLEWLSRSENLRHSLATGLHANPERPVVAYADDGRGFWFKSQAAAREFGFTQANISKCINGERHTHKGFRWEFAA